MSTCAAAFENAPEYRDPIDLTIRGTIPPWLDGSLYRTGPGTTRIPTTADPSKTIDVQHWFDGLGMHHRFEVSSGGQRVSYRSHKGAEDVERRIADAGEFPAFSFGQRDDPCKNIFRKFFSVWGTGKQASAPPSVPPLTPAGRNVSVTLTPDMPGWNTDDLKLSPSSGPRYLVAKTDANILQLLDPETLQPLVAASYKAIDPRLDGQRAAAHSCRDPETGDYFNFVQAVHPGSCTYKVFKIDGEHGKVEILAEITDAPASYLHSFAMTGRYVILSVWQSYFVNPSKNTLDAIDTNWDPAKDTLFYVVDRKAGGVVSKYKTPPFYCFHQLNAFDDPDTGDVVIDKAIYHDNSVLNLLYLERIREGGATPWLVSVARRFRLQDPSTPSEDVRNAIVDFTRPDTESIELPVVAPRVNHKPYRFVYGLHKDKALTNHSFADGIIKLDMSSPDSDGTKRWIIPDHTPSEPIFVPRPGGEDEDDGVLLTVVFDEKNAHSAMVVLDAKSMEEVGRAEMPSVYPMGFHGVWTGR